MGERRGGSSVGTVGLTDFRPLNYVVIYLDSMRLRFGGRKWERNGYIVNWCDKAVATAREK